MLGNVDGSCSDSPHQVLTTRARKEESKSDSSQNASGRIVLEGIFALVY